jgi:hypothetical protein
MDLNWHYRALDKLSRLMDTQFSIFGCKFGLDPLIGILPFIGDALPAAVSLYTILIAAAQKTPSRVILKMFINTFIDVALGSVPFIGDLIDVAYKSHRKNYRLLITHAPPTALPAPASRPAA